MQSLKLNRNQIHGVTITKDTMHVISDTSNHWKSIVAVDLKTGRNLKRTDIEASDLIYYDQDVLIFKIYKSRDLICYETATHKEKWKSVIDKKVGGRFYTHTVSKDHICVGYNSKMQIINRLTGKPVSAFITDTGDTWTHGFTGSKLFSGERDVIVAKTGAKEKDVLKVFTAKNIGGAILYKDKSLKWFDHKGELSLEKPNSSFMYWLEHGGRQKSFVNGNTIYITARNCIICYDRNSGKILSAKKMAYDFYINTVLNNSVIASTGAHAFVMHDIDQQNAALTVATVSNLNKTGWPQDGWVKPQSISRKFWIPGTTKKSYHKYALQFGTDDSHHYIHIYCSPARDGGTERIFKSIVSYGDDIEKHFEIKWDIDRTPHAIVNLSNQKFIKSWKRIDRKGNIHCYIVLDHSHIEKNSGRHHQSININISEYQSGTHEGSYLFGGLAMLEHFKELGRLSSQQITTIKNDDNFKFRKNTYDSNSNIIPQGTDLAKWVVSYRGIHGFEKTISYLKKMCIRCKDSTININILACLLNERLKQWSQKNPDIYEVSDQFRTARTSIIKELKNFANKAGIDSMNSEYGLTIIAVETFPFDYHNQYFSYLGTRGSSKHRGDLHTYLRSDNPFAPAMTHRPLVSNHFIGGFDVNAPGAMTTVRFGNTPTAIGRVEYISPAKTLVFMKRDGTLANGCKGMPDDKDKVRAKKDLIIEKMTYGEKIYNVINYHTNNRYREIKIDEIVFPEIKKVDFTKKELLQALENLPSDSSLGDDIIAKMHSQLEQKEYPALWETVVRQTAGDLNSQGHTEQALDKLMYYFTLNNQGLEQANKKLKAIMSKNRVARNIQRKVFLKYNNCIIGSERWFNLGSIIKVEGKSLSPLPESVDNVFDQKFTYNDKEYNFITSTKKMPKGQWGCTYHLDNITNHDPALSYHQSSFDLREDKKVFLYFGQKYTGRTMKFTIWIDGDEVCSKIIPHNSRNPLMHSLRLKRGTHKILIGLEFRRGWDFTFHIGDISGLPLDEVTYPPTISLK